MQVEDFYQAVKDADYLIYNSTIDNSVSSLGDLLDKCRLLSDFKAVREGNVWCMSNDTYQQPLSAAYLIEDFHAMLSGGQGSQMHYLFPLE